MKVCPDCNSQAPDDTRYCPECGSPVREANASASQERASQDDVIGRVLFGEYTITQQLGEGGMGAVYLAEQNSIDQKIALKVLHAEAAESDEIIQRFHREAKVISMISHPNIVRVFIFGRTEDDLLYLAMEHVDGTELREQLDGTPIDELTAIKIMKQVCSAVAEAHDIGIIHRDLKPENILMTEHRDEQNYVKILDFGIAKIKHPDGQQQGPQLTQAGIVYGTPEYLSPEQAQAHDLDNRTDIYALGCMLFEMLTGRVPFQAKSSVEILKQKVFEDPPRPSDIVEVAPTMEQIIMKAMAPDREDRYGDALEMFDALDGREKEIQKERHLNQGDTWFPGSELTGVHRAVDEEAAAQAQNQQIANQQNAAGQPAAGTNPPAAGANQSAAHAQDLDHADTMAMEAPEGSAEIEPDPAGGANTNGQQPASRRRQPTASNGAQTNGQQQPRGGQPMPGQGAQQTNPPMNSPQPNPQQGPPDQQPPPDQQGGGGDDVVRYLLIGAVVVLGLAVVGLAGYLIVIVTSS
jgi:serine/threonine-protein kinase